MIAARVYRFHDDVAVTIGDAGSTIYLPAHIALRLSFALAHAAVDIQTVSFTKSTLATKEVDG